MNEQTMHSEYVDGMLRLAFRMEADDAVKDILDQSDQSWSPEDDAVAKHALLQAWTVADQQNKKATAAARRKKIGNFIRQTGKIAACIIIVLALAFPVALAASAEFRAYVMKLMMVWDQTNGEAHFSFVKQEENNFVVPEEWEGEWYPSFIPNDLEFIHFEPLLNIAEYASHDKIRQMWFSEMDESYSMMMGTEGAEVSEISINNMPGWMIYTDESDDGSIAGLVWSGSDRWFRISAFNLSRDEVIAIAESVKIIVK